MPATTFLAVTVALLSAPGLANPISAPNTCGQLQMWTYEQGTHDICGPTPRFPPVFNQPSGPTGCQRVPDQTSVMWLQSNVENANIEWFYDAACEQVNLGGSLKNKCTGDFTDDNHNSGKGWFYRITC